MTVRSMGSVGVAKLAAIVLGLGALFASASAEAAKIEIQVANFDNGMSGAVWAVAKDRGFFAKHGLDVDIRTSVGGSADVRALVSGNLPFVESGVSSVIAAIGQGADIKIISDDASTLGSTMWFTLGNSPINSLKDLKGHRLAYSNPQSATQMVDLMLLDKLGYTTKDVQMIAAGGIGPELVLLDKGGVDAVTAGNQLFYAAPAGKYKALGNVGAELPPVTNVVGLTTSKAMREQGDTIRALLAARREAVEFTEAHPDEAAESMAKVAKWDLAVTKKVVHDLVGKGFWSQGNFGPHDMDNAVAGLVQVGVLPKPVDWKAMVDEQFLPADLRTLGKH